MSELLILFPVLVWGANYCIVKSSLYHFLPPVFNAIRFVVASFVLLILCRNLSKLSHIFRNDFRQIFFTGFTGCFVYQIFFVFGVHATLAGMAAFISATTPLFVAVFSHWLGREKLRAWLWTGIALSILGVFFITFGTGHGFSVQPSYLRGNLLILVGSMLWAVYILGIEPLCRRYGTLPSVTASFLVGTPFLLLFSIPFLLRQNWRVLTRGDWGGLLFSGVFALAVSQIFFYYVIRKIGGTRTALYGNIVPIVATGIAYFTLRETLQLYEILGAVLIVIAILLARIEFSYPSAE